MHPQVINKRKAEQLSSGGEKDSSKKDDRKDDDAVLRIGKGLFSL